MPEASVLQITFSSQADPNQVVIQLNKTAVVVAKPFRPEAESPAWCKILCKRYSTKPRMALEDRADRRVKPLSTNGSDGRGGMRAACGVNAVMAV